MSLAFTRDLADVTPRVTATTELEDLGQRYAGLGMLVGKFPPQQPAVEDHR